MGSSKKIVPRERREFSADFKAEAVRMVAERRVAGVSLTQIGRALDVRPDRLRARGEANGTGTLHPGETPEPQVRRLRREVATRQRVRGGRVESW